VLTLELNWQKCDVIYEQNNVSASLIEQKYLNHNNLQQGNAKVPHAYVIILTLSASVVAVTSDRQFVRNSSAVELLLCFLFLWWCETALFSLLMMAWDSSGFSSYDGVRQLWFLFLWWCETVWRVVVECHGHM